MALALLLLLGLLSSSAASATFPSFLSNAFSHRSSSSQSRKELIPYDDKPRLTFDRHGRFKIASFSDMHYGEGEEVDWGPEQDVNTTRVHNNILDAEAPDFVLFNGDLVTGENLFKANATAYVHQVFAPTVKRGLPFASSYGNHDNSKAINHGDILQVEQDYALSYTRSDVGPKPYGHVNYWIPIYKDNKEKKPSFLLWVFDSRSFVDNLFGTDYNDWVDEKTVPAWINSTTKLMRKEWGDVPPSLAFVHIPVHASHAAYDLASSPSRSLDFSGNVADGDPNAQGDSPPGGAYKKQDQPFWDALTREIGGNDGRGLLGVVSGHDHGESFCARGKLTNAVPICFNGHSGYGGYSSYARNARIFSLEYNQVKKSWPSIGSWNRYEDGTLAEAVVLGRDFGGRL